MQSDIEALQRTSFFADLPPEHLAQLAIFSQHRHFEEDAVIFSEGDPSFSLYLIQEGEVKISVLSPTNRDITLALLGPGDAFGELALLDKSERSATATATGPTEVIMVNRNDFLKLVESEPAALRGLLAALSRTIRNMNQKLADVAMLDVHGRMAKALFELIERHGVKVEDGIKIDREVSIDDLAGIIGLYPSHVERLMRDLQYENVITYEDEIITIRREDVLRQALRQG
jgi:CRP/FNR family cyclic AMP-dependent transcriptional regulator